MALDSDAGEVVKVGSVAVPRTAGIGAKASRDMQQLGVGCTPPLGGSPSPA